MSSEQVRRTDTPVRVASRTDLRLQTDAELPSIPTFRPGALDLLGMLTGFLLPLAITVLNSRGRLFWEDEMLGWLLLRDPSWHHMLRAWNLGADGGGFSFYLLGRGWFHLFGDSVLAFHLFSGTCFGLAFAVLWGALRRFYPVWIVPFAAFNSLFFSPPLTTHFLEGRFYGLLFLSTALALWLGLVLDALPEPTPRRFYLLAFLAHGLLTTSHVLGVVYSAMLLLGTVVLDRMRGRQRWRLYLAAASAWLLLIPEKQSIAAAGRVGKPHFWTKAPTPKEIVGAWTGFSHEIQFVLVLLVFSAGIALLRSPEGPWTRMRQAGARRSALYVLGGALLLVPVVFLLEGLVGTWLFNDRYLQPVTLGVACLTAELLCLASGLTALRRLRQGRPGVNLVLSGAAGVVFALFLLVWDFHHVAEITPEPLDFAAELSSHLPHDLPVVVEDAFTFTSLLSSQASSGVPYRFLLDWQWALDPEAPRLEVTQYHLMENWKLAGYYADYIENAATFLAAHPRFLVVHNGPVAPDPNGPKPEIGNPLAERLGRLPGYEVRPYFILDRRLHDGMRDSVFLVCRGGCGAAADLSSVPQHCQISATGTDCCTGFGCRLPEPAQPKPFWRRLLHRR